MKRENGAAKSTQKQAEFDIARRQRKKEASKPIYLLRYE